MDQRLVHNSKKRSLFLLLISGLFILFFSSVVALANENKVTVLASTLNVRYGPGYLTRSSLRSTTAIGWMFSVKKMNGTKYALNPNRSAGSPAGW